MEVKFVKKIINIFAPREKSTHGVTFYMNAKKVMKVSQILHSKLVRLNEDKRVKKLRGASNQNNIIHIKKKNQDMGTSGKDKHGGLALLQTKP